jgi:hypothetical protein
MRHAAAVAIGLLLAGCSGTSVVDGSVADQVHQTLASKATCAGTHQGVHVACANYLEVRQAAATLPGWKCTDRSSFRDTEFALWRSDAGAIAIEVSLFDRPVSAHLGTVVWSGDTEPVRIQAVRLPSHGFLELGPFSDEVASFEVYLYNFTFTATPPALFAHQGISVQLVEDQPWYTSTVEVESTPYYFHLMHTNRQGELRAWVASSGIEGDGWDLRHRVIQTAGHGFTLMAEPPLLPPPLEDPC